MNKAYTITGERELHRDKHEVTLTGGQDMQVSDGYHTMDELYEHRITLWIAMLRCMSGKYGIHWRSKLHSDGTSFEGWFILGYGYAKGEQITYHLPIERWEECDFVSETLERAPEWDGHTSSDVISRLKQL